MSHSFGIVAALCIFLYSLLIHLESAVVKEYPLHLGKCFRICCCKFFCCSDCDLCRLLQREVIDPGGNGRKSDSLYSVLRSKFQAGAIAGCQQFPLSVFPAMSDRSGRMNHIFTRKPVSLCNLRFAGFTAVELPAFLQQIWPCCTVNSAFQPLRLPAGWYSLH